MANKDYYKILGVEKNASKEEIKKAYKKLAKKYHPDISKESDAEIRFKEVNEAAGVLLDDNKKQQYDTYGTADGPQGFGGFGGGGFDPRDFGVNIDDIFEQFGFGGFGGSNSRRRQSRSYKDTRIYHDVEITLDDAFTGIEKDITITRDIICDACEGTGAQDKSSVKTCPTCDGEGYVFETQRSLLGLIRTQKVCPTCHGEGKVIENPCKKCGGSGTIKKKETITVKIPKGVEDGVTLRVSGKGDYDSNTKTYGDLYVRIAVINNKDFEVDGADLYMQISINFIQAILGDEIDFDLFGKKLGLKIPSGTQPGTVLRLKGKGMPHLNGSGYGNLYIKTNIEIPKNITSEQKKILDQYAKTEKQSIFGKFKSFFK